ncbi:MAG: HNH endonuclease signature motif containing protein [Bacilli bacterium]
MISKYYEFLENCRKRDYSNLNTHIHHIIPKCDGGSDDASNLIELSVRDHFLAHLIYAEETGKCLTTPQFMMTKLCAREDFTEEEWNNADIRSRKLNSIALTGRPSSLKGKHLSEETKQKLREKMLGRVLTEDHKRKIGISGKGKHPKFPEVCRRHKGWNHTEETKLKMTNSALSRNMKNVLDKIVINNGFINKYIYKFDIIPEGWVKGRLTIPRNYKHSEETKEKIRKPKLGKAPWNKGLRLATNAIKGIIVNE